MSARAHKLQRFREAVFTVETCDLFCRVIVAKSFSGGVVCVYVGFLRLGFSLICDIVVWRSSMNPKPFRSDVFVMGDLPCRVGFCYGKGPRKQFS